MENEDEKIQQCALEAIMRTTGCKDIKEAAKYASMNYSVYSAALEAARIAKEKFSV